MIRLFANASYDFIALRRWAYGVTAAFVVPGLVLLLLVRGFTYSVEFTGGTEVQVQTADAVGTAAISAALAGVGIHDAEILTFGSPRDYLIRTRLSAADTVSEAGTTRVSETVRGALQQALGPPPAFRIVRTEAVGPKVGRELQAKAFLAILASFGAVLVYLALRFEWRFGLAAVVATAHDIVATIVFTRYMDLEVSLVVVAGLLTMVGYSLNDTIIIFDRVRENLRKFKRKDLPRILNLSINETLPRSILTHGTTMATLLALLIFAGETIRPFAWVMTFGVFTGTFSSIFIAAPVLLLIEQRWPGQDARGARLLTEEAGPARPALAPAAPGGGGGGRAG